MKTVLEVLAVAAAVVVSDACPAPGNLVKSDPSAETAAIAASPPKDAAAPVVTAYDCDDGSRVVADYRPLDDVVWLFLPGRTVELQHQRSGSGGRYSDGEIVYWSTGRQATVEYGDTRLQCTPDVRASVIERAKLAGADFWATGNEPGWTLEIFADHMVLVTDYGQKRIEAPTPGPPADDDQLATVYRTAVGEHSLVVTLVADACVDSMSGEVFSTTVGIELDGCLMPGCGQALH